MKTTKGFAPVGIILIIIAKIAIGGVVYYVWNNPNILSKNVVEICLPTTSPWIKIISPNGGEEFKIGDTITINWATCNVSADSWISLELLGGGSINTKIPISQKSYSWMIPNSYMVGDVFVNLQPKNNYKIKISLYTGVNKDCSAWGYIPEKDCIDSSAKVISSDESDNSFTIKPKTTNIANWETYSNSQYGFDLSYPSGYLLDESNNGGFFNEINLFNLSIKVPNDYQKGTDFNVGRVTVTVSSTTSKCYSSNSTYEDMTATKTINEKSFRYNSKQPFDDNAMGGQRGSWSIFSTIENGRCYRIEKRIGYRDLRGLKDPPYLPHFDEQKVNLDLDNIISTFLIK